MPISLKIMLQRCNSHFLSPPVLFWTRRLISILLPSFKFTEAIRIEPKKHDLYLQRSSVYRLRSEFQESSSDASKAIYLSPNSYEGWVCRELALEGLGKPGRFGQLVRETVVLSRSSGCP